MNKQAFKQNSSGQVVILLLLIMVVALAIGLSTIGRSILEVSTSRKSEDSSRAFSAAEAAIERAMKANENNIGGTYLPVTGFSSSNNQAAGAVTGMSIPAASNYALAWDEPLTKRNFAQFWLADPNNITVQKYTGNSFDLYFGDPNANYRPSPPGNLDNQPAIEITVIYWDNTAGQYKSSRKYYDSFLDRDGFVPTPLRAGSGFSGCDHTNTTTYINDGTSKDYYCKATFTLPFINSDTVFPVVVRVRILYSELDHDVALKPETTAEASFPKQATVYSSDGTSGEVKRTLKVTSYKNVMPFFFDYVLFSANNLTK
ncbi:MAG: pilus assembly PilX N-terminal domain-containing protein [Candidatus Daviesbacteria bacterium]|nr:pilus assembly PilX N-terminal domain-containing protein [Candidatus Daviesbacteria bacterium]